MNSIYSIEHLRREFIQINGYDFFKVHPLYYQKIISSNDSIYFVVANDYSYLVTGRFYTVYSYNLKTKKIKKASELSQFETRKQVLSYLNYLTR